MKKYLLLVFLLSLFAGIGKGQKFYTVSGFIEDSVSCERLGGATLLECGQKRGTASNAYGFFSLTLPQGDYFFRTDYVGYHPRYFSLHLHRDTTLILSLKSAGLLQEVTIKGNRPFATAGSIGQHTLPLKQIRTMPTLAGESDVLKALQYLPGVNSGTEGTTGISVRGGTPDQTQILLDGIPVYNVNHAFGYFSVFNDAALKEVTLLKSTVPARYGGRLSSVLDITMREGNLRHYTAEATVSPLAGTVTAEGPIVKDKASFLVSGRFCWGNALLQLVQTMINPDFRVGYNFYDLNGKINWKASNKDRFYLSFYNGRDGYYSRWNTEGNTKPDKDGFHWGNISVAGRWNHVIGSRAFTNVTLYYSRFHYAKYQHIYMTGEKKYDRVGSKSEMEDFTLKADLDYFPHASHHFRFGLTGGRQTLTPELSYRFNGATDSIWKDETRGAHWSFGAYAEDSWLLSEHWTANIGLRATGQKTADGKIYYSVEPRLALSLQLSPLSSVKASWTLMQQPLHLLQNSSLEWNVDMWVPVTRQVQPGRSSLYSVGYYRQLPHRIEFSAEGWYSDFRHMIRYANGVRYQKQNGRSWQEYIYTGRGRAYGLDIMLNKPDGALNGWVAYSLSKAERSFPQINRGKWFPSEYDRRHKINVVANYLFQENTTKKFRKILSFNFVYTSGNYTTVGHQIYPIANGSGALNHEYELYYPEYIKHINNTRLPAYHHLDVAFHLKNDKRRSESWSFGIYNVYFRKNPSFYFQKQKEGNTEIRKMSLLPFVPSITYTYRF